MIGKFWDELFRYADKAKADKDEQRYEIVHEIEDILQNAYDLGISSSRVVVGYEGKNEMERLILSIPDIEVFHDDSDGTVWYELTFEYDDRTDAARRRFDTPQEIIKYLIQYRTATIRRRRVG